MMRGREYVEDENDDGDGEYVEDDNDDGDDETDEG